MEQEIRYLDVDGGRVAYASIGNGPPIVFGPRWVSHLEEEWLDPEQRSFFTELARSHRIVRFDRIGTGLSSRRLESPPSVDGESRQLEAVVRTLGEPAVVFVTSCCAAAAATLALRAPALVPKLVFFGVHAARDDVPEATRRSLVEFTRTNWPLAAQLFAGLFDPHASGEEIRRATRVQRAVTSAETAAALVELELTSDLREVLPLLQMPALVLHRRGDRTVPIARGREFASLLPNVRFVPLAGDAHLPWRDDRRELQRALAGFLASDAPAAPAAASPLTGRETEVLRLVSTGMSNREIATMLVLSEHTVHRHVANILRKLAQSTRAAAATHALRAGIL